MVETDYLNAPNRKYAYERERFFVYSIVNLDNGKRYIGRTKNPRQRIMSHFAALKSHRHPNKQMNEDSKKGCRFGYEILESGISYEERSKECEIMLRFKTNDERYGYNFKDPYFRGR